MKATAIICPSKHVKQQVQDWVASAEQHLPVYQLYNACSLTDVRTDAAEQFRAVHGFAGKRLIGCIGRLHPDKHIEDAIRALTLTRKTVSNAHLVVIGGYDTPSEKQYFAFLESIAITEGVRSAVTFTGYVDPGSISVAMAALDLCILPSKSESFGRVLMEAWSQGIPTVASDVNGCREITNASGGGLLVPVRNVEMFSEGICDLLQDDSKREKMGACGRCWVLSSCHPKRYAEAFYSILQDILQQKPPSGCHVSPPTTS